MYVKNIEVLSRAKGLSYCGVGLMLGVCLVGVMYIRLLSMS